MSSTIGAPKNEQKPCRIAPSPPRGTAGVEASCEGRRMRGVVMRFRGTQRFQLSQVLCRLRRGAGIARRSTDPGVKPVVAGSNPGDVTLELFGQCDDDALGSA